MFNYILKQEVREETSGLFLDVRGAFAIRVFECTVCDNWPGVGGSGGGALPVACMHAVFEALKSQICHR